jgi:4-hydroxybenzoate polyprenyltransferase
MQHLKHFFKLIRLPNLLIILLTQIATRYFLIDTVLKNSGLELMYSTFEFSCLLFSTFCIAAAGYIINNYYDVEVDLENKPNNVVVQKWFSLKTTLNLHYVFNFLGIVSAFYVAQKSGVLELALIQVFTAGLLYFYSTDFKQRVLVGNLVIALLCALVPVLVLIFELPLIIIQFKKIVLNEEQFFLSNPDIPKIITQNIESLKYLVGGFAGFAFLVSLMREIIKDCEDIEGDKSHFYNTLPIAYGKNKAVFFVASITVFTLCLLGMLAYKQYIEKYSYLSAYLAVFVLLPLFIFLLQLISKKFRYRFSSLSFQLKGIMILGILYQAAYWYVNTKMQ